MGVSFEDNTILCCYEDEREWFNSLPEKGGYKRLPASHFDTDCPVRLVAMSDGGKHLHLSTFGYGVMDFTDNLPESCYGFVRAVTSLQGQDINFVECEEEDDAFLLREKDWEPYGKEGLDFNFFGTLPEDDEDEDGAWEAHEEKMVAWFNEKWEKNQRYLNVDKPLPLFD